MNWTAQLRAIGEKAAAGNEAARRYLTSLVGDVERYDMDVWVSDFLGGRKPRSKSQSGGIKLALEEIHRLAEGERAWANETRMPFVPASVVCWLHERPIDEIRRRARAIVEARDRQKRNPPRCDHCGQPLPKHMRKH